MALIFYRYMEGVAVKQKENMAEEHTPWVVLLRGTRISQGVKGVLEAKAVELPTKGVCDRVGVFFWDGKIERGHGSRSHNEEPPLVEEVDVCWAESERVWVRGLLQILTPAQREEVPTVPMMATRFPPVSEGEPRGWV